MNKVKLICLFLFILNFVLPTQSQSIIKDKNASTIIKNRGELYFRFPVPKHPETIFSQISVDKIKNGYVYAYASKNQFTKFLNFKIEYELLTAPSLLNPAAIIMADSLHEMQNWDRYPTYELYVQMMKKMANDYPEICKLDTIGYSKNNRLLMVLKISDSVNLDQAEPEFFYSSTIHGDEPSGYVLMLRLADYLLSNYGSNPRITSLINNMEIWINPLANPDGTYYSGNHTISGATRYNANSIDINRNFPDPRLGQHPDGNQWQPETNAMITFSGLHNFTMAANLHGGAELANYPFDTWTSATKTHSDNTWWKFVSREYADTVHVNSIPGYFTDEDNGVTNGGDWYVIAGGRQDYMNWWRKCREFTLEISEKMLDANLLPAHWNYNYRSLLNYMEEACYGIHGIVTDSVTGLPLQAKVFINNHDRDSSHVYSSVINGDYHRPIFAGTYSVNYSAPGYYSKTVPDVIVQNHQTVLVDVQLVPIGSGIESGSVEGFRVFPNPAKNIVKIFANQPIDQIIVYDLTGKLVYQQALARERWEYTLNTLPWMNGIYTVIIQTKSSIFRNKLVISR